MAMQRMVDIEVDPEFNIHTSYHSDFFLLKTRVTVNGENTQIKEDRSYEEPTLVYGNNISAKLWLITNTISPILHKFGVYHMDTFYYERSPLFHVVFSSELCLEKFLLETDRIKYAMQVALLSVLLESNSSHNLVVEVQPELFLVSPNRHKTKGVDLYPVAKGNYSTFANHWKSSELFDFGSLYQEEAVPPKITTHPQELMGIHLGKTVSLTVQATGTQPVSYQWQWKPAGKEEGCEEWQNISCDSTIFQEVQVGTGGLKLTSFQESNVGYYRCVVSNSAGSETSQCINLVIAAELTDLVNELHEVNDWIPFGLNLGIDISRLEAIEKERPTIDERRTQLFIYWQKQVVPTWSTVVKALMAIGMRRLASKVAQKHGVLVSEWSDDDASEQLVNLSQQEETSATGSELLAEVQKRSVDIRKVDVERMDTKTQLTNSQKSIASIDKNINQILCNISELQDKVESIAHERSITNDKLESKQQECQLLSEMQDVLAEGIRDSKKQHQWFWKKDQEKDRQLQGKEVAYRMLLEKIITKKMKKIEKLEEELRQKDSDLRSAQQEARSLNEKLLQARVELKMKHEEVKQLQKENEELACSYNIEKEQVSKLIQIAVILTADKTKIEQQLVSMRDESKLKSQQIGDCNSRITCLSKKVEALSCSLKEKEATAAQLQNEQSSHEFVSSTAEQLLELLKLQPQIAELECKLQEAEYKQQQAELEKRAVVQEMEAREKLEVRLCEQLGLTTTVKIEESEASCPPSRLQLRIPLTLNWRQYRDMPCGMVGLQSVTVRQKVFVGGGVTDSIYGDDQRTVHEYHPPTDQWVLLPLYKHVRFAMAILADKLTLVGGISTPTMEVTNQIAVWEEEGVSRGWTYPYPPMTTPRYSPAVATYDRWLVVAGGYSGEPLATVEVLDTTSHQWMPTTQLPVKGYNMTSAIIDQEWFLVGGSLATEALVVSLPDIIPSSVHSATTHRSTQWRTILAPPLEYSAATALCGSVVAIGGLHGKERSTAIFVYQPATNIWNKVGDSPSARSHCSCTILPSSEILVLGGYDSKDKRSCRVDSAAFPEHRRKQI